MVNHVVTPIPCFAGAYNTVTVIEKSKKHDDEF
jgi:hypothetical protein